jgi:hypothetical protein
MPSKSKNNRRNLYPNKAQDTPQRTPGVSQVSQTQEAPSNGARNLRQSSTANTAAKTMLDMNTAAEYFKSEIKWISLVTALIVIFLIASFFLFR